MFYPLLFVICELLFDIWHLILDTWHCTFPIPHLIFYIDIWHPELWSWSWSLTELATLILLIDTITVSIVTWSSTEPTFTVLGGTDTPGILTCWHLTFWFWHYDKFDISTEGTDSTSTDGNDIGTILSHFHWWILRLSAILEKYHSLSYRDSDP